MATIRICDRCGAPAAVADIKGSNATVIIPKDAPATNQDRAIDAEVSLAIQITPQDLCAICARSALIGYAKARLGATPDAGKGKG